MPELTIANETSAADFIARWHASGSAERANYAMFLTELCGLLSVPGPHPTRPDDRDNAYVFERAVPMEDGDGKVTVGRIDLYKRGCFVLEAKQGSAAAGADPDLFALDAPAARARRGTAVRGTAGWDAAMKKAKGQAERYVRSLPPDEGNPPFILVVDVGHVIELYADFSRLGKIYTPFPDSQTYRIPLADLAKPAVRDRLARVWTDPLNLDPTRHSAKVTRLIAEKLAKLAKSFESAGHHAEVVAAFLTRCLFTFFAEDVGLIEIERTGEQPFTDLLKTLRGHAEQFVPMVQDVWSRMDAGGFSPAMRRRLRHFNGKLFKECHALPVTPAQLELLIEAGESDWSDVEPAIFGTLLERALEPRERHKLGAHYTPRAYVERLVLPTVIEPLREKWDAARAASFTLNMQGKNAEARAAVHAFLADLCNTTVLDPACGSANFLYVTMEHMKKLEGEARDELRQLGETQELLERGGLTVDPHQFLGLEINPRAVAIAELVLWIGYLKWHLRTLGHAPNEPLLRAFDNIKQQDAVLAYDRKEVVTDEAGKPVSRWDGHTMKKSPVTGENVPDVAARTPVYRYVNPRKAEWPKADYVVGNPPYIGARRIRLTLSDEYVESLRRAYDLTETCDYVMYWWHKAANRVGHRESQRFGFITTNSIVQSYSNIVIEHHLTGTDGVRICYAIADHPWVEAADGADVRVAMTVCVPKGDALPIAKLAKTAKEDDREGAELLTEAVGCITPALKSNFGTGEVHPLRGNGGMCYQGIVPAGEGFKLRDNDMRPLGLDEHFLPAVVRPYVIGRDLVQRRERKYIIDFFGLDMEAARSSWPALYQRLVDRVLPEREQNKRSSYKKKWWIFAEPRPAFRRAVAGLRRFILTPYTAKHRPFIFTESGTVPDAMAYAIASDDSAILGVLSSRFHVLWALTAGGRLGVGNDPRYTSDKTFLPYPFPVCTETQQARIRTLGESLDAHRKRQQTLHSGLTITDMYNVLEKLRKNEELTAKDRLVHEQGLVSVLRQIHDDLDAAVSDAYGWPAPSAGSGRAMPEEEILRRLVALNAERAEEEKRGLIRWLRPDFQNPAGTSAAQETLSLKAADKSAKSKKAEKQPWPKSLAEQAQAVRSALSARAKPATAVEVSAQFKGAKAERVAELLATLATLGQARTVGGKRFVA